MKLFPRRTSVMGIASVMALFTITVSSVQGHRQKDNLQRKPPSKEAVVRGGFQTSLPASRIQSMAMASAQPLAQSTPLGTLAVPPVPPQQHQPWLWPSKRAVPKRATSTRSYESPRRYHRRRLVRTTTTSALPVVKSKTRTGLRRLDALLFAVHFCNMIAWTLPVCLIPVMAGELSSTPARFTASMASISTLGAAVGKFVNGFVCQHLGGRTSSYLYLGGLATSCAALGLAQASHIPFLLGGVDFFASIQWTSLLVILSNHYSQSPQQMATGIAILSLASTAGTLTSKTLGTLLLQWMEWRQVAFAGGAIALLGALIGNAFVTELPPNSTAAPTKKKDSQASIAESLRRVLGSPLFWLMGLAHAFTFLGRTSERVLGTFFQQATGFSRSLCGGLTASLTLGLMGGLVVMGRYLGQQSPRDRQRLLQFMYGGAVVAASGLAVLSNAALNISSSVRALGIALCSAAMAANVAYQCYQIPPLVAQQFGSSKAVCLSFLDGLAYLLSFAVWAVTNKLVANFGWSATWSLLAVLIATGGVFMSYGTTRLWNLQPMAAPASRRRRPAYIPVS